jgi:hypothetical protein
MFEVERSALLPLPASLFPSFTEARRKVHRDGHVEFDKAYYSVPPEYLGLTVWARWDARTVRVFNQRMQQVALHARHEQGRFSTLGAHIAREKISGLEQGVTGLLAKVQRMGPHAHAWAQAMVTARGIEGTRVLLGLISLTKKHDSGVLEKACEIALSHGAFRLRVIRALLKRSADKQQPLPFLTEHPLIRPLDDYAGIVAAAHERGHRCRSRGEGFLRHGSHQSGQLDGNPSGQNSAGQLREAAIPRQPQAAPCAASTLRSGYPSPGCTSAEPDSVSPDTASVIPVSAPFQQELP